MMPKDFYTEEAEKVQSLLNMVSDQYAEIAQLRADFDDCNFTREALKQQVIKLRALLEQTLENIANKRMPRQNIAGPIRAVLAKVPLKAL